MISRTQKKIAIYYKFVNAIKSKTTKMDYTHRLTYFINFLNAKFTLKLVENKDKETIENDIINYLIYLRKKRRLSFASASQYRTSSKVLLCKF